MAHAQNRPLDVLRFTPLLGHEPGIILGLLAQSYRELVDSSPEFAASETPRWAEYEREAFSHPDTVGACIFVTCLGQIPIGFGSWEPVPNRGLGFVGHNCILPGHRRQGYGTRQLREIVHRVKARGLRTIKVTTSDHPFFTPARSMYGSFGFREVGHRSGGSIPGYGLVDYELPQPPDVQ
jgi:GNAT superfamily N-acetyltransferase